MIVQQVLQGVSLFPSTRVLIGDLQEPNGATDTTSSLHFQHFAQTPIQTARTK